MSDASSRATHWLRAHCQQIVGLLNHDFLPHYNHWIHWIKRPVGALSIVIVMALLMGVVMNPRMLAVAAILSTLLATGIAWPWITMRGITCSLRFDQPRVRVGGMVDVIVTVTNRWPWPAWGLSLQGGLGASAGLAITRVSGWSRTEFRGSFTPHERGCYPQVAPWVESGFPLGLWHAQSRVDVEGELLAWPETRVLSNVPDVAASDSLDDQLSDHRSGEFGDLLGTRNFAEGDSLRRVHWAQTARYQRLIVCERQAGAVAAFQVVLDIADGHYATADDYETAVSVFASVCESLQREHAQVDAYVGPHRFVIGRGLHEIRRLADALARLPHFGQPTDGLQALPLHERDGVLNIVVTGSRRQLSHRFHLPNTRVIAIGPIAEQASGTCWLCLTTKHLHELPLRWRRGCHAN
jgi:uncharacterized protein (DUF58 family)